MRRLLTILVTVLLFAPALAACGGDDVQPAEAPDPGAGTTLTPAQPTPTSEPAADATPEPAETPTGAVADPQPTPAPSAPEVAAPDGFGYGFNIAWRGDDGGADYNRRTLQAVEDAGFNWVRVQIEWADIERARHEWHPLGVDRLLEAYEGSDVKILVSVVEAPDWARDPTGEQFLRDYADWEGFMHFLAERYRGRVHAWQIWNEQNLAANMGGRVRVEDYARLLQAGYTGVKLADPEAIVVFGGTSPTGVMDPAVAIDDVVYLEQFYALEDGYFTRFFDVLGVHVNSTNNPPDTMWPSNPGPGEWSDHASFYFRRTEQLRQVMATHGDSRPIWITEFGWTTENQAPGYEYGADNSEEEQAQYLVDAFELARRDWPWVEAMFVWNLNFSTMAPETDEKFPWSVLNADWSPRPAYEALRAMPKP